MIYFQFFILNYFVLQMQGQATWKNRRSQKLDKMAILDLQSNLQSEIQAKEYIRKELSNAKAKQSEMEKFVQFSFKQSFVALISRF